MHTRVPHFALLQCVNAKCGTNRFITPVPGNPYGNDAAPAGTDAGCGGRVSNIITPVPGTSWHLFVWHLYYCSERHLVVIGSLDHKAPSVFD